MATHHCLACDQDKGTDEFYESSPNKCKACVLKRQKELKDAKAKGGGATTAKAKGAKLKKAKVAKAPVEQKPDSFYGRPPGMGFNLQLEVDESTKLTDIRIDQWNATAGVTQQIWLNQLEAHEVLSWLTEQLGL